MKPNPRLFFAILVIYFNASFGQGEPVLFRNGTVHPESNIRSSFIDSFNLHAIRIDQKAFAIFQFSRIPNSSDLKILNSNKIELLDYIPNKAYTVTIASDLSVAILQQAGVNAVLVPPPSTKMDAFLSKNYFPSWAVKAEGTVDVLFSFPRTFQFSEILNELKKRNWEVLSVTSQAYRLVRIRISQSQLNEIASLPFVEYLQAAPPQDQTLNSNSLYGSRANALQAPVVNGGKGLNGEGVVVGVGDNADVQTHADFSGRTINRNPLWAAGHGHHVAGTVGGAGNLNEIYKGYAPKATIITQSFSSIFTNASTYVQDHGMVITNNSYGNIIECEYHGIYDLLSRTLDQMAFDLPDLTNVFAAGNSGHTTCPPYAPGYHTVLGSYQSAKNVITVGATNDSGVVAFFSSRGPVLDGRMKPEITAMGQFVASAWPTNIYSYNNGTSMAAPAVSGGLALLYQRYRQLHGGANPKNGLMKAVLSNGAIDKGNAGPDHQNGFGWMNLLRSVEMLEKNWYFNASVSQANQNTHTISVPANTAQIKVMLYWNDPAASMLSNRILVNDLDLTVVTPSQTVFLPKIADTARNSLDNVAVQGIDRINNIEQVTIDNPAAGNYTVRVSGTSINQNFSQEYFLVYDIVPVQLKIVNPVERQAVLPSTLNKLNWDAFGFSSGLVNIELSTDDGNSWTTMANGIDINRPTYSWWTPATAAEKARIRITKQGTGETSVSGAFTILGLPSLSLDPVQCESYVSINWTSVPGATAYQVMRLIGDEMKVVHTTNAHSHVFSGLSKDSNVYVTVRPLLNDRIGMRAPALIRKPDNGNCTGSISDGDLVLDAIVSPVSGRKHTSTAPGPSSAVIIRIKNLDDAAVNSFEVKYAVNGNAWISETVNATITGGGSYDHSFAIPADLSAAGDYNITAVVKNLLPDAVAINDTASLVVRILNNDPLDLSTPFADNFETALPAIYQRDMIGLMGLDRYDYSGTTLIKRARSFINSGISRSGTKAITLDADRYSVGGNTNYLTGTFNLSDYTVASHDLRLDFYFLNHGQLNHQANKVWIRGSDNDAWIEVYDLAVNQEEPGTYKKSASIEISQRLAEASQQYSSSFQVRWGQHGITSAADRLTSAGYSFDDVRVYQVSNDIQLRSIDAPGAAGCQFSGNETISITVRNSTKASVSNLPVKYRINNGTWLNEIIPSVGAGASISYHFSAKANLSAVGSYILQVVTDFGSDSFRENDTLTKTIRNLPLINSFPYLQNFEAGEGSWYAQGMRSSWSFGNPNSYKIKGAASGTKAWKTNLVGAHQAKELSYLYSPCFDLSGMTNPTLSFSVSLDIEDCGNSICDAAWVEYSADGTNWQKLGSQGAGTNWYTKAGAQVWAIQNFTNWHVATSSLPAGLNRLRLRFVFASDEGAERDGIALDDIHIYDNTKGIYDGITMSSPSVAPVNGNGWTDIVKDGKLLASIHPKNQNLGNTAVTAYIHNGTVRNNNSQYYHNRNLTINPSAHELPDSVLVRFYFLESETDALIKATGCTGCAKPGSAYNVGVSKYSDIDTQFENGTLADNQQGLWSFIEQGKLAIVPFDKGYYAEFSIKDFSEFWLSNGGFGSLAPLPVKMMSFTAKKSGPNDVRIEWKVGAETGVQQYEIELAKGESDLLAGNFIRIGEVAGQGNTTSVRDYHFTDTEPNKSGARYYRLKIINDNGSFVYSPVRSVVYDEASLWQVFPNPSAGIFNLMFQLNPDQKIFTSLFDSKGRLIKRMEERGSGFTQKIEIDLSEMAAGVYLLQTDVEGKRQSFKLYKQ